jgi:hypothetical protein
MAQRLKYQGTAAIFYVRKLRYEVFRDANGAILREKQINGGSRAKKIELINCKNPEWLDLYNELRDCFALLAMTKYFFVSGHCEENEIRSDF